MSGFQLADDIPQDAENLGSVGVQDGIPVAIFLIFVPEGGTAGLDFQFEQQKKQVDLKKYMGRGEKLFQSDAQEAIRELRDYDRL